MTRETKIGLLVGLAFIIVVGILISDHVNSSTDPLPANLPQTAKVIDQSVGSPDRNDGKMTVVNPPQPVIPQNPVQTQHDPQPPADGGSTIVQVGPGGDPSMLRPPAARAIDSNPPRTLEITPPNGGDTAGDGNPNTALANNPPASAWPAQPTSPNSRTPIADNRGSTGSNELVNQHPQDLVPVNKPPVGIDDPRPVAGIRQVKAEEGDTVTRLAQKYLGANNKANRETIIKANPSMTPDGHLVIAGRTYLIPGASNGTTAGQTLAPTPIAQNPAPPTPAPRAKPQALPPGMTIYSVKENDSLWKIAAEQLGSGSRYAEIRDLNQDVLKGSEQLHVNMRLKLPAKAVASTN
jgi:nucleoid-associated protein YgaU